MTRTAAQPPLLPRTPGVTVPLSDMQRLLWTHALAEGRRFNPRYFLIGTRILGKFNARLLETGLRGVIERHEPLRTRLLRVGGRNIQCIDPPGDPGLEVVNLTARAADGLAEELRVRAEEFMARKFDRSLGPLFGAQLFRLSGREHVLLLSLDHVITDIVSNVVVCRDLWTLYRHAASGSSVSLPQLRVQFADYILWQQHRHGGWLTRHGPYWKERLQGIRVPIVPIDSGVCSNDPPTAVALTIAFGADITAGLRALAQRRRTLLPLVVLAIYSAVMSSWCGREDLLIAVVQHGRFRPELVRMVGWLNNFLHLRIHVRASQSCQDFILAVAREFQEAVAHEDFNRVPVLLPECATDLRFDWLPRPPAPGPREAVSTGAGFVLQPYSIARRTPPPKFEIFFGESPEGIVGRLCYRSNLFRAETMSRLAEALRQFAATFVRRPLDPVGSVPVDWPGR